MSPRLRSHISCLESGQLVRQWKGGILPSYRRKHQTGPKRTIHVANRCLRYWRNALAPPGSSDDDEHAGLAKVMSDVVDLLGRVGRLCSRMEMVLKSVN